jgi:hypothetical protein
MPVMPTRTHYSRALNTLLLLTEELSYIAQPIDSFLTILWHPDEKRAVGFQLMEAQLLFSRLHAILVFNDYDTVPLYKVVEMARMGGLIEATPDSSDLDEANRFYDIAQKLAGAITLSPGNWKQGPSTPPKQAVIGDGPQRNHLLEQAALILEQEGWLLARMTHDGVGGNRVARFRDRFEAWQQKVREFRDHNAGVWPEPPDNS